jgi:MFS family permease
VNNSPLASRNPILRYLYDSWIQTCGVGWTPGQIIIGYVFSVLLALGVLLAAYAGGLGWSWVQIAAAALLAWDLFGGTIGYNHPAMKRRRLQETSDVPVWHHNLQHIHPLVLIFFNNPAWLLGVTLYWFATFFLYVEFLEIVPATGKRRLSVTAQKWVIGFEIAVALALIGASFVVADVPADYRLYGMVVYGGLVLATFILIHTPLPYQRTTAVISLVSLIVIGLFLSPPAGFQWLLPVYFLKLLVGFTAKENKERSDDLDDVR